MVPAPDVVAANSVAVAELPAVGNKVEVVRLGEDIVGLVADLLLHGLNCIGLICLNGDDLARQRLHKPLHAAT